MFVEWMNTFPAVLVPQFNCFIITGWHNQSIIWRKSTRNKIYISRSKHMNIFQPQANRERCMGKCVISAYLAQRTQLMCWLREKRNFCLWTVQTLMVLSSEAVTRVCPSLEKLTLRTEAVWALKDVDSAFLCIYINTETHKIEKHSKTYMCFLFYADRNKEHVPTNPLMVKMISLHWKSNV